MPDQREVPVVDMDDLVRHMRTIELNSTTRGGAVLELVQAGSWQEEGVSVDSVVEAIEAREAAAQTVIAPDMALPHAAINWDGNYRLVLGRSRTGVQYGAAGDIVHLIVLLVVGKQGQSIHLQLLARIAELLQAADLPQALVNATNVAAISRLLSQRAIRSTADRPCPGQNVPLLNGLLIHHAAELAKSLEAQALLVAVDTSACVPWSSLVNWQGPLLIVTSNSADELKVQRAATHLFKIPHAALARLDRANLGLLLAAAEGLVTVAMDVVCVTGLPGQPLDSITVTRPRAHFHAVFSGRAAGSNRSISPAVIMRVLSLAVEIGSEGREGQPIGAMFVVGDSRGVLRHAQQLVLNPFYGIPRRLRNVLDPSLAETIKEFSQLDGAFIIDDSGTAMAAGTYLIPESRVNDLPGGLGTRHQAAAGITADTRALAITVSQSTGTVSVFHDGSIVLRLERAAMTRW